jgi:hypothetical protein
VAEPVELPHDERVAALRGFQATGEGRAFDVSAGHFVLEHGLASSLIQGGKLHGRVLVFGADAGVVAFNPPISGLAFWIRKPLFSLGILRVPKLTLCWTPADHCDRRSVDVPRTLPRRCARYCRM